MLNTTDKIVIGMMTGLTVLLAGGIDFLWQYDHRVKNTTPVSQTATIPLLKVPQKGPRDMAVGETIGTCSFQVTSNGSIWLTDRKATPFDWCIKVRRDTDGFTAILPKTIRRTADSTPEKGSIPVKRIEIEP